MLVKKNWAEARFHRDRFNRWWEQNAHTLNFPMVYLGDEPNTYKFDWDQDDSVLDSTFKILFATPNSYVTAVGNAALPLFYQELHEYNPDWVIERGYFPSDRSEYDKFDKAGIVPFSFEGKMPYSAFDVLCFTQSVAGQELHIIDDLIRSGIAPKWQDRKEEDPIIIRGGCNSFNPSNIKDVCDIYYIGEGEDGVPQLLEFIEKGLREGKSKEEILLGAANLRDGLWVPRFYEERYDEDGNLVGMFRLRDDVPEKIRKDYIRDLDNTFIYTKPVVTFLDPGMSAGEVEITRGCHGGCSFCQEGMCVSGDTLITTSDGYVPIEDYAVRTVPNSALPLSKVVLTDAGMDFATSIYNGGQKTLRRIVTHLGYEISATYPHPLRVMNKRGEYKWKKARDIQPGDYLALQVGGYFGGHNFVSLDEAKLLGLLVGDGCYTNFSDVRFCYNSEDKDVADFVYKVFTDMGVNPAMGSDCVRTRSLGNYLEGLQIKESPAWEKEIPIVVLRGTADIQRAFLSGLFEADGYVGNHNRKPAVCLTTTSKKLAQQVQLVLLGLGVVSRIRSSKGTRRPRWDVCILGDSRRTYLSEIGFLSERKVRLQNQVIASMSIHGSLGTAPVDGIPCQHDWVRCWGNSMRLDRKSKARTVYDSFGGSRPNSTLTPAALQAILDSFDGSERADVRDHFERLAELSVVYTKVEFVEDYSGMTYDLVVPSSHTFIANGFVSHNTYLPYRERSVDVSMDALKTSQMYGGSPDVLPSAFCSSTYSSVKTILKRTLEEVSDEISLISQRVDEFAGDPNFVQLTSFAGNKTVSLGVEGNSQRMRDAVSKNCTTEQIIEAVRLAYIYGYQKIKLFMIANLPGETPEDVAEVVDLARQLREMLDANKIEGKAFPRITFSWTPLSIQPFTPYQWCKPPIGERSLGDVLKPIKEYGFRVRIGGNSGSSAAEKIIQLTQRADARLQDLFIELAKNGVTYFGGMPAKALDITEKYFRTHGLPGWDYWFRQCSEDNVFPWDFIDIGVKKEYLWKRYLVATSEEPHPFTKCLDGCNNCGVCHKEDYQRYSQYRKQEAEDKEVDVSRIVPAYQTGNVQRLILKIETDEKHRFVGVDHWRFAVRRAFMLAGIPVSKKSITMASGVVPYRDWSYGVDYVSCNLVEKQSDVTEIISRLNEYACNFKVVDARLYPYTGATVRNSMDLAYYEMEIDQDVNAARARIREVLDSTTWVVPIKKEGFMGTQTEEVDVRGWVEDLWMANEGGKLMLRMKIRGELSPYVVYQNLFNLSWKKAGKYPARRIDIFLKVDETSDDMFRPRCEECGKHIEVNIFDTPVDQFLCYKDQDKENGVYVE